MSLVPLFIAGIWFDCGGFHSTRHYALIRIEPNDCFDLLRDNMFVFADWG
jgi:hypothetical protein